LFFSRRFNQYPPIFLHPQNQLTCDTGVINQKINCLNCPAPSACKPADASDLLMPHCAEKLSHPALLIVFSLIFGSSALCA